MTLDPFDLALSEFIDSLPEAPEEARGLLAGAGPFHGSGDLPELAELATMLRAFDPPRPSAEWMAASKARVLAAVPAPRPRRLRLPDLGAAWQPLRNLRLPQLALPSLSGAPLLARAAVAAAVLMALGSAAYRQSQLTPVSPPAQASSAPAADAERAITLAEREVSQLPQESAPPESQVAGVYIKGTPQDVTLISQYVNQADQAIQQAPADQRPKLEAQLQTVVRAVRFDGTVQAINGDQVTLSGVTVTVSARQAQQLAVGQTVSVIANLGHNGQTTAAVLLPPPVSSARPVPGAAQPYAPPAGDPSSVVQGVAIQAGQQQRPDRADAGKDKPAPASADGEPGRSKGRRQTADSQSTASPELAPPALGPQGAENKSHAPAGPGPAATSHAALAATPHDQAPADGAPAAHQPGPPAGPRIAPAAAAPDQDRPASGSDSHQVAGAQPRALNSGTSSAGISSSVPSSTDGGPKPAKADVSGNHAFAAAQSHDHGKPAAGPGPTSSSPDHPGSDAHKHR